jgi:hypothetical protein
MRTPVPPLFVLFTGCADAPDVVGGVADLTPMDAPHGEATRDRHVLTVGSLHSGWSGEVVGGVSLSDDGLEGHATIMGYTCAFPITRGAIVTTYDRDLGDEDVDDTITDGGVHTAIAPADDEVWLITKDATTGEYEEASLPISDVRAARLVDGGFLALLDADGGCEARWFGMDGTSGAGHVVADACDADADFVLDRASGRAWTIAAGMLVRVDAFGVTPLVAAEQVAVDVRSGTVTMMAGDVVYVWQGDDPRWMRPEPGIVDLAVVDGTVVLLLDRDGYDEIVALDGESGAELDRVDVNPNSRRLVASYSATVFGVVYPSYVEVYELGS